MLRIVGFAFQVFSGFFSFFQVFFGSDSEILFGFVRLCSDTFGFRAAPGCWFAARIWG